MKIALAHSSRITTTRKDKRQAFSAFQTHVVARLILYIGLMMLLSTTTASTQSISIVDVPSLLPRNTPFGIYSPSVSFTYGGLQAGQQYVLKVWLLAPGPWYCASSQWCERTFPLDNATGSNPSGTIQIVEPMDVYDYSTFDWVVRLFDSGGAQVAFAERYVNATSDRPPILARIGHPSATPGTLLQFTLSALDPQNSPLTFAASPLPSGATLDHASGLFSWTPTTINPFTLLFTVTDSAGLEDAELVTLQSPETESVLLSDVPPVLPRNTSLSAYSPVIRFHYGGLQAGLSYTMKVWLLDPTTGNCASSQWCEHTFAVDNTAGTNATGEIQVVDNMDVYDYGGFEWLVRLFNANNVQVAIGDELIPATTNRPPILNHIGPLRANLRQKTQFSVRAFDPQGLSLSYDATPLPSGATFDRNSGLFSWTPQVEGQYTILFATSDTAGLVDAEIATITVTRGPQIVTQPQGQVVRPGASVTLTVGVSDQEPVTYQWQFNGTNIAGATSSALTLSTLSTKTAGTYRVAVSDSASSVVSQDAILIAAQNRTARQSVLASISHLAREMDFNYSTISVSTDVSAPASHFYARGQLPDQSSAVTMNGSWTNNPHSGATCTRCTYSPQGEDFGGFYLLNGILVGVSPLPYFGESVVPNTSMPVAGFTGLDLSGAVLLSFWARGEDGGEQIQFFMGGVGRDAGSGLAINPYPDSTPRFPQLGKTIKLTRNWRKYSISLRGLNLTNVMGGFAWVADAKHNPTGAVFYLDDIQYQLGPQRLIQRLNEPRFIRSFVTRPRQPDIHDVNQDDDLDFVLRNTAFIYDNAVALLAFLAEGSRGSIRRAILIGNAMVYAANHDRTYTDGRIRTAYAAGDLALPPGWDANGKPATAAVPGFYDESVQSFFEVENADVDTGNNAWAMIALLALHKKTGDPVYLNAALRIGAFIQTMRNNSGLYQGFLGGIQNAESANPVRRPYASTEHNLDIYAAFTVMFELTGDPAWQEAAAHASAFVDSMWSESKGVNFAGTLGDPNLRNELPGQLPLDTHSWAVLALPDVLSRHPGLFTAPETFHRNSSDGFTGFDFNDDKDGVWFEGTAQMAVAYAFGNRLPDAEALRQVLRTAQQTPPPDGNGLGTPAASHDGVSSGFAFKLFHRLHIGATSWNVFGQLAFNPYYQTNAIVPTHP
jgi:hypothetical protein